MSKTVKKCCLFLSLSSSLSLSVVTVTTTVAIPFIRNLYLCGKMVTLVMEKDRDFMEIILLRRRVKLMWH